jgi:predicted molibdopterin-dependent oxidoreductase YjgC
VRVSEGGRLPGIASGEDVAFTFEGRELRARRGETVAMALWAAGIVALRASSRDGSPRGVLCNMGVCYECLVRIGGTSVRACTTVVEPGMAVERGGRR